MEFAYSGGARGGVRLELEKEIGGWEKIAWRWSVIRRSGDLRGRGAALYINVVMYCYTVVH